MGHELIVIVVPNIDGSVPGLNDWSKFVYVRVTRRVGQGKLGIGSRTSFSMFQLVCKVVGLKPFVTGVRMITLSIVRYELYEFGVASVMGQPQRGPYEAPRNVSVVVIFEFI